MDKDGFISNGELFQVLKMMVGSNLKDTQLQQIVDKTIINADKDGDGRISFEEFCAVSSEGPSGPCGGRRRLSSVASRVFVSSRSLVDWTFTRRWWWTSDALFSFFFSIQQNAKSILSVCETPSSPLPPPRAYEVFEYLSGTE